MCFMVIKWNAASSKLYITTQRKNSTPVVLCIMCMFVKTLNRIMVNGIL